MTDREKLIKLLKSDQKVLQAAGVSGTATLRLADILLAGGVMVRDDQETPLTLDELRRMDCEPVYIWYIYPQCGEWVIAEEFNQCENFTSANRYIGDCGDYGKTWLAYRSKPKEAK